MAAWVHAMSPGCSVGFLMAAGDGRGMAIRGHGAMNPHDLARLSLVSKDCYAIAHAVASCTKHVALRKLHAGTIQLVDPAEETPNGGSGSEDSTQQARANEWVPRATEAGVQAWPDLVFVHRAGTLALARTPQGWVGGAPNVLLVLGSPCFAGLDDMSVMASALSSVFSAALLFGPQSSQHQHQHQHQHQQPRTRSAVHALSIRRAAGLVDLHLHHFGSLRTLTITMAPALTNVEPLRYIHTLHLHGCAGLEDVSALCHVHTLSLLGCTGVVDVAALGSVHNLSLQDCTRVEDVSALGRVHSLSLQVIQGKWSLEQAHVCIMQMAWQNRTVCSG